VNVVCSSYGAFQGHLGQQSPLSTTSQCGWNLNHSYSPITVPTNTFFFQIESAKPIHQISSPPKLINLTVWECSKCHSHQDLKAVYEVWLEVYQSSFLFCWLHRLARKGGRNLAGYTLDCMLPIPTAWKEKLNQRLKRSVAYYEKNCWDYADIFKRFKAGKPVRLSDYWKKTIINLRIEGTVTRFYEGQIFSGLARFVLLVLTYYDVGKYAYRAYKHPEEKDKNLKKCLLQAIKWTLGTEIGNIGFDIGANIAPTNKHWALAGFLMEALWSATFDKLLQKYFPPDK